MTRHRSCLGDHDQGVLFRQGLSERDFVPLALSPANGAATPRVAHCAETSATLETAKPGDESTLVRAFGSCSPVSGWLQTRIGFGKPEKAIVDGITQIANHLIGQSDVARSLTALQMAVRSALVYLGGLAIVRLGKNRVLGRSTAFDIILGFVLGSLLSRAINGGAPIIPTLAAALTLLLLHWGIALVALRSKKLDGILKGHRILLVEDGRVRTENLRIAVVSRSDLLEALRLAGKPEDLDAVRCAYLERSGQISTVVESK